MKTPSVYDVSTVWSRMYDWPSDRRFVCFIDLCVSLSRQIFCIVPPIFFLSWSSLQWRSLSESLQNMYRTHTQRICFKLIPIPRTIQFVFVYEIPLGKKILRERKKTETFCVIAFYSMSTNEFMLKECGRIFVFARI